MAESLQDTAAVETTLPVTVRVIDKGAGRGKTVELRVAGATILRRDVYRGDIETAEGAARVALGTLFDNIAMVADREFGCCD